MIKNSRVELGKTPSVVSGQKSNQLQRGEPVKKGEKPVDPGLHKLTSALGTRTKARHV